jgi:stage II sporulation protein D
MGFIDSPRLRRWLAPLVPLCILAAACAAGATLLASCGGEDTARPVEERPFTLHGVPTVRVLLGSRPVDAAVIATTGDCRLLLDGRSVSRLADRLPPTRVTRTGGTWHLGKTDLDGGELLLETGPSSFAMLGRLKYRGTFQLLPSGDSHILIVNDVDLESYLAGVLPKELYAHWHIEAYRAQAIAARTFALHHVLTSGRTRQYDVGDGQSFQVYGGLLVETDKAWRAIRSTHGMVLGYGPAGREGVFRAHYCSCCGGRVNGAIVLRKAMDIPPLLGGQICEDCRDCPRYRWPAVTLPKAHVLWALARAYPAFGRLKGIRELRVHAATSYGRAVWLDVVGTGGTVERIRAEDLRLVLLRSGLPAAKKLYSMNCRIVHEGDNIVFADGRGWGHGVGLCQHGAQAKALAAQTYRDILAFYYPQSTLIHAY